VETRKMPLRIVAPCPACYRPGMVITLTCNRPDIREAAVCSACGYGYDRPVGIPKTEPK
jgi:hypothetical protein